MGGAVSSERALAATIQAGAALAVAELQRQSEKEKLELQKDIWEQQRKWAAMYHDLWYEHYRPLEMAYLEEIKNLKPYEAQYDAVQRRAVSDVRREFLGARSKIERCIDVRAIGLRCEHKKHLAIEEARASVSAINRAWRAEEARKDVKDNERDVKIQNMIQLGRGLGANALGALGNAAATASSMSSNKYGGYAAAIGDIASTVGNLIMDSRSSSGSSPQGHQYTFDYDSGSGSFAGMRIGT